MTRRVSRRTFVVEGSRMAAGALAATLVPACRRKPDLAPPPVEATFADATIGSFASLQVAGGPREIGLLGGKRFGDAIRASMERRADWWKGLKDFAAGEGKDAVAAFGKASRKHAPRAFAELEGWAEGSGVPLDDLLVMNVKCEIEELLKKRADAPKVEPHAGCSTVVLREGGRLIHLHNEDGHDSCADLMFVMRARPDEGPAWVALCYPGILPGNAPGVNDAGIAVTTNYIASREVKLGVGRYFLDRMILESSTLDEAVGWSTHPERSFAFHHVVTDLPGKRAKAVEVSVSAEKVMDIDGLYFHTNHLVLPGMTGEEQDEEYVSTSSTTRLNVISRWAEAAGDLSKLRRDDLLAPLASHEGKPYSPCRHPEGDVHGFTLGTAVFEAPGRTMRLAKHQPCLGRWMDYDA